MLHVTVTVISSCLTLSLNQETEDLTISENKALDTSCSPWKYLKYNSSCVCGDTLNNIVVCENDQPNVKVLTCHCMSYSDYTDNVILVGNCPYLCTNYFYTEIHNHTDITSLCNRDIQQSRAGQMCGKCAHNFAPAPFS